MERVPDACRAHDSTLNSPAPRPRPGCECSRRRLWESEETYRAASRSRTLYGALMFARPRAAGSPRVSSDSPRVCSTAALRLHHPLVLLVRAAFPSTPHWDRPVCDSHLGRRARDDSGAFVFPEGSTCAFGAGLLFGGSFRDVSWPERQASSRVPRPHVSPAICLPAGRHAARVGLSEILARRGSKAASTCRSSCSVPSTASRASASS